MEKKAKAIRNWLKDPYLYAMVLVFVFVVIRRFSPELTGNEKIYLLPARRLLDPSFLANDWTVGAASRFDNLTLLFSILIAPLWYWLGNPLAVALVGRTIIWILLIGSLAKLARELDVKWYCFAAGLGIWLYVNQALGAGEWIFGGVEQKCLAYVFLFLAIASLLRYQDVRAGIYTGLAISFHTLVGGWSAIALTGALAVCFREYGVRRLARFVLLTAAIGSPLLLVGLWYSMAPAAGDSREAAAILVKALPFHLDPKYFLGAKKLVTLYVVCSLWLVAKTFGGTKRKFLFSFLMIQILIFAAGIVARYLEFYWFLKFYPFRLADVLVPLFFWMLAPGFLIQSLRLLRKQWFPRTISTLSSHALLLVVAVVVIHTGRFAFSQVQDRFPKFISAWREYPNATETAFQEMARWIRRNTAKETTVVVSPCEKDFWMEAERATVVSRFLVPHNNRVLEWKRRMTALNAGKPLDGRCSSMGENYMNLDLLRLTTIHQTYNAGYYLTEMRRDDLHDKLVHRNDEYYLYDLHELARNAGGLVLTAPRK